MKWFIPAAALGSVVAVVVAIPSSQPAVAEAPGGATKEVCHTPPPAPTDFDGFILRVPLKAVSGHLKHGDCETFATSENLIHCNCISNG